MSNSLNIPAVTIQSLASGVVDVSPPPAVQPILAAAPVQISDTTGNPVVSTNGSLEVTTSNAPSSTITFVTVPAGTTTLLAANPLRKGFILYVDGSLPIFVSYDGSAAVNHYSFQLVVQTIYKENVYTGTLTAVAPPTLSSQVVVTEIF